MNRRERSLARRDPAALVREAAYQEQQRRKANARARSRPRRANGLTREDRRKATRIETARIREACVLRAAGLGELCGRPLDPETMQTAHLDGGSGKRLLLQSEANCLMEHEEHHRSLDRFPLAWLPEVKRWCERHGYGLPERFRKLEILRGTEARRG